MTADTDVDRNLWKNLPLWPSNLNRRTELGQLAASETLSNRVGMTMGRFVRGLLFYVKACISVQHVTSFRRTPGTLIFGYLQFTEYEHL